MQQWNVGELWNVRGFSLKVIIDCLFYQLLSINHFDQIDKVFLTHDESLRLYKLSFSLTNGFGEIWHKILWILNLFKCVEIVLNNISSSVSIILLQILTRAQNFL